MAWHSRSTSGLHWPTAVWLVVTVALLLSSAGMLWQIFSAGETPEQALQNVQRIEFDLRYADGNAIPYNLQGETLSLETARAMHAVTSAAHIPAAQQAMPDTAPQNGAQGDASTAPPASPAPAPDSEATAAPSQASTTTTAAPAETGDAPPQKTPPTEQSPSPSSPPAEASPAAPPPAAQPELLPVERMTDAGIVPTIAKDGTMPWQYFAKKDYPRTGDQPRIAVVIRGLGLSRSDTEAALALPAEVTLAFSPYGRIAGQKLARRARDEGHELLLDLPMQTERYPADDPGPYGLRPHFSPAENAKLLQTSLSQLRGYAGLLAPSRDVLSLKREVTAPFIEQVAAHGLLFVSGYSQRPDGMFRLTRRAGVPILFTHIELDGRVNASHIRNQLARAEDTAHNQGMALVVGNPYPLTLELLHDWLDGLAEKGFSLVPVTALATQTEGEE